MNANSKTKLGLWLSTFISIVGLLLIVLLSYIIEKTLDPSLNKSLLTIISVIIAVIPPLLWLTIFYRQDRLNPEPKSFVFKTLLLGALVQKAIYTPLISLVFPNGETSLSTIARNYFITLILVAMIQEAAKLLSVRYSVYGSKEFDESIDGIIYGSALGLGFAAMTSIDNILSNGGALLSNVTSLVVIETFAHASITGLSCYILGVSKQMKFNIFRLPIALVLATALNAFTQFLLNAVTRRGFKVNYIVGLIPAALVAILVFTVLVVISSKSEKEGSKKSAEPLEPHKAFMGILPVWILLAAAIVAGFLVSNSARSVAAFNVENVVEVKYPSDWIQFKDGDALFKAADMIKGGQDFVSVKKLSMGGIKTGDNATEEEVLQNAAASWSIKAGMNYRFYQAEKGYYLNSKGKETYVIDYVYISNSQSNLGETLKPAIGYARDILSISGNNLYVVTLSASYDAYVLNNNILDEVQYTYMGN